MALYQIKMTKNTPIITITRNTGIFQYGFIDIIIDEDVVCSLTKKTPQQTVPITPGSHLIYASLRKGRTYSTPLFIHVQDNERLIFDVCLQFKEWLLCIPFYYHMRLLGDYGVIALKRRQLPFQTSINIKSTVLEKKKVETN